MAQFLNVMFRLHALHVNSSNSQKITKQVSSLLIFQHKEISLFTCLKPLVSKVTYVSGLNVIIRHHALHVNGSKFQKTTKQGSSFLVFQQEEISLFTCTNPLVPKVTHVSAQNEPNFLGSNGKFHPNLSLRTPIKTISHHPMNQTKLTYTYFQREIWQCISILTFSFWLSLPSR